MGQSAATKAVWVITDKIVEHKEQIIIKLLKTRCRVTRCVWPIHQQKKLLTVFCQKLSHFPSRRA